MPRINYETKCSVKGCHKYEHAKQMCQAHYRKFMRDGNFEYKRRLNGEGDATDVHIRVAEKALGKRLPKGAVIHHIDEDHSNNAPANLVICPNQSYHMTIHNRMRKLNISFRR